MQTSSQTNKRQTFIRLLTFLLRTSSCMCGGNGGEISACWRSYCFLHEKIDKQTRKAAYLFTTTYERARERKRREGGQSNVVPRRGGPRRTCNKYTHRPTMRRTCTRWTRHSSMYNGKGVKI